MVLYFKKILALTLIFFFLGFSVVFAATLETVNIDSNGILGNLVSNIAAAGAGGGAGGASSYDGRFVVFNTVSALVPEDTNGLSDIYVRDRLLQTTERISVNSLGEEANGASDTATISYNGRFVAFRSTATNLVSDDLNGVADIFVYDRQTGETKRVSINSLGEEANGAPLFNIKISGNGRFVMFDSSATNLVPGDVNNADDVFVHDRQTGETERVALESTGLGISYDGRYVLIDDWSSRYIYDRIDDVTINFDTGGGYVSMSGNGKFVTFRSGACDLAVICVVVYDVENETSEVVSVNNQGEEPAGSLSMDSSLSHDGRFVAFWSDATTLVSGYAGTSEDRYIYDRVTGAIRLTSPGIGGGFSNDVVRYGTISPDGFSDIYVSEATNLIAGDTNGVGDVFVFTFNVYPTNINLSSNTIQENEDVGTLIGVLTTEDADVGNVHTYSFTCDTPGDDDASFSIDGDTLLSAEVFDYDTKDEYNICIRTEDELGAYFDKNFSVTILEVASPPPPPPTSISSGSYIAPSNVFGCINPLALNFNPNANQSDKSCIFPIIDIPGCTNSSATNFNIFANQDNGSCVYEKEEPKIIEQAEVQEKKDVIEKSKTEPIEKKDESTEVNSDEEFIVPSSMEETVDLKKSKESKNLKSVLLIGTASLIIVFSTYNWARNLV